MNRWRQFSRSGSSVQGDQSLQTLSAGELSFAFIHNSIIIHRAGFEPAPPKRVGLESTALDRSANDALSLSFSFL